MGLISIPTCIFKRLQEIESDRQLCLIPYRDAMDNIVVPANVPKDESVAPTTLEDDGLNAPIAVQQDISSAIDEAVTPMTTTTGDELLDLESLSRSKHQPKIESTKIPDIVDTVVEGPASINNQDDDWTMGFAPRKRRLPKYEPIKFKDAVGRQYSFPFHTVRTWIVSD